MRAHTHALLTLVDVERDCSHSYPDHALAMVEKLDGLGIQREIGQMLKWDTEEKDIEEKDIEQAGHQHTANRSAHWGKSPLSRV